MQDVTRLIIWHRAVALAAEVGKTFPALLPIEWMILVGFSPFGCPRAETIAESAVRRPPRAWSPRWQSMVLGHDRKLDVIDG
jgi:hypothetical protein